MQYSAGPLCADSLLLISLDAAGTNDKYTLPAVARRLLLSSCTAEWAELMWLVGSTLLPHWGRMTTDEGRSLPSVLCCDEVWK
jgi:hypothetical protein